jgi:cytochrome c-type biogenesis protein CcmH
MRRPDLRLAAVAALVAWASLAASPARAVAPDARQEVEGRLMCYCGCANLTIRDCTCGTAAGVKADIADRLASGESPDQVVAAYVARHGEQIRSAPPRRGFNLLAWVTPFAAILGGAAMIVALTRRWRARGATALPGPDTPSGGAAEAAGDSATLERIAREMRDTL